MFSLLAHLVHCLVNRPSKFFEGDLLRFEALTDHFQGHCIGSGCDAACQVRCFLQDFTELVVIRRAHESRTPRKKAEGEATRRPLALDFGSGAMRLTRFRTTTTDRRGDGRWQ